MINDRYHTIRSRFGYCSGRHIIELDGTLSEKCSIGLVDQHFNKWTTSEPIHSILTIECGTGIIRYRDSILATLGPLTGSGMGMILDFNENRIDIYVDGVPQGSWPLRFGSDGNEHKEPFMLYPIYSTSKRPAYSLSLRGHLDGTVPWISPLSDDDKKLISSSKLDVSKTTLNGIVYLSDIKEAPVFNCNIWLPHQPNWRYNDNGRTVSAVPMKRSVRTTPFPHCPQPHTTN
jgi:hypothetical protein